MTQNQWSGPRNRRAALFSGLFACGLAGLMLFSAACGDDDDDPTEPVVEPEIAPFPADYRDTWVQVRDCRFSNPHDGNFIIVHADPASAQDYLDGNYPFEEGATFVKTMHNSDACDEASVVGFVIMVKGPAGTDPDNGDWIWIEANRDREVQDDIVVQNCIGCHSACTATDYACTEP